MAGKTLATDIAMWDAASERWTAFGAQFDGQVTSLAVMPNGDLMVGGIFSTADGVTTVLRWSGTGWSAMNTGMNNMVWAMVVMPNGDLVVGGDFDRTVNGYANHIARWNGTEWNVLGTGVSDRVRALTVMPNGDLVAAGLFGTAGGVSVGAVAR